MVSLYIFLYLQANEFVYSDFILNLYLNNVFFIEAKYNNNLK